MISENTHLEVIAELEFKHSNDPEQRVVEIQRSLGGGNLAVVKGFRGEYGYYLVRVEEINEGISDEESVELEWGGDGDHPLDPSSYEEPEDDDGCECETENTYEVSDSRSESRSEEGNAFEVTD